MKKVTMVIAACIIALAACKKEKDKYFVSANVDSESFYTDTLHQAPPGLYIGIACMENDSIHSLFVGATRRQWVSNMAFATEDIEFYIDSPYTGTGTYNLTVSGSYGYYYDWNGNPWRVSSTDSASSGTVTITSDANNVIKGTFTMSVKGATDTFIQITNGKFCIPITYQ